MKLARASRREGLRTIPGWARAWCVLLGVLLVLHGALPLVHAAASHGSDCAARAGHGDRTTHEDHGDATEHHDHESPSREGPCETCRQLVLVKQAVPWQSPLLLVLPRQAAKPGPERAESRPLVVWRRSAPARGPPARA